MQPENAALPGIDFHGHLTVEIANRVQDYSEEVARQFA